MLVADPGLLEDLPTATLAAVVIAAGLSLVDVGAIARLWRLGSSEFWLALASFLGVAFVGVIEGVFFAVALSLLAFIRRAWWPHDAVMGRADGVKGYHDLTYYPEARQVPGLVLYRFDAPLFFANADVFRDRIRERIASAEQPVRWVVVAAEPITDVDTTAAAMLDDPRSRARRRRASPSRSPSSRTRSGRACAATGRSSASRTSGSSRPSGRRCRRYLEATGESWTDWEEDAGRTADGPRSTVRRPGSRASPLPGRADRRDDRRQDRVEVADDGVGRAGHHRRVAVGVDGQDRLGRAGSRPCAGSRR